MMGTGIFAEPTFASLLASRHAVVGLFTQPDRTSGTAKASSRLAKLGMKDLAVERNVPVFQPETINTPESVADLRNLNPDLYVVAAYGQILSRDVLAVPPLGGINVHASLLPKYRGAAPINWAIYQGETSSGVTIIRMSTQLDAGDMLLQESLDILVDETAGELEMRLAPLGAKLAMATVDRFASGEAVTGTKQDKNLATKAPKLTKEMGLIDWTQPAARVCQQVRAMQPWPTPYTFLHRPESAITRLIVAKAKPGPGPNTSASHEAGDIVISPNPLTLWVAAQGSWVEVLEVQPAGKRRMPVAEFLRGLQQRESLRFGPESPSN